MGLAFDARGRLYVSTDATGEIFRVRYTNSSNGVNGPASSLGSRNLAFAYVIAFFAIVLSISLQL